jgi:HK97 family phage major capsid protein
MPTPIAEQRQEFATKQRELAEIMELAKDGKQFDLTRKAVMERLGAIDAADALGKVKARNVELDDLGEALRQSELKYINEAISERGEEREQPLRGGVPHASAHGEGAKTLGGMLVETKAYLHGMRTGQIGASVTLDVGVKALMTRAAGFAPESTRSGLLVPNVNFSLAELLDLIPAFPTDQASFKYMEETTRTHAATEVDEGGAYPEATFVYTERESAVRKIGDHIPVTDEQLEDVNMVASLLDQRLSYGVRRRLASQILNGSGVGTPTQLRGVLNVVGIQTQAKGADSIMAAAYKAITKCRFTGQAEPNAFVFHPNDWQDVVLAQESTGNFLWGHPSMGPATSLWGLPVALSVGIAENTALVGDWINFSRLDEKRGVDVQVGYIGDQFKEGKKTLRADMRAAFTVTRPAAFCTITGV